MRQGEALESLRRLVAGKSSVCVMRDAWHHHYGGEESRYRTKREVWVDMWKKHFDGETFKECVSKAYAYYRAVCEMRINQVERRAA